MMNAEARTTEIQKVRDQDNTVGSKRIIYKGENSLKQAYEIPVESLIFNQYNGRIGTYVKTWEKIHGTEIDPTTKDGEDLIVDFLWKSKITKNQDTKKDIEDKGQQEVGIVTKDGVVIDGNRRCMLLKKIDKERHNTPTYFRAIILDDKLSDNPKEIRKLETSYQLGVDQPQDYNAIEKYLKCKELFYEDGFSAQEIGKMMGETASKVESYLSILALMEKFLKAYGYEGIYTYLSDIDAEGPFVDVDQYLKKYKLSNGNIKGRDWTPEPDDIDDLESIYFDYIRAGYGTHKIRCIGNTASKKGFFNTKEVWEKFIEHYEENVEPTNNKEKSLDTLREERPDENTEALIKARDRDWKEAKSDNGKKLIANLQENLGKSQRSLDDAVEEEGPLTYLTRAVSALARVDINNPAFDSSKHIEDAITDINSYTWAFKKALKDKSKNNE